MDLGESGESETEGDPDAQSTTSCEDLAKLQPELLLLKAAQARNLPVMLEALAFGADANWRNPDDHGATPLIRAVSTVSICYCPSVSMKPME